MDQVDMKTKEFWGYQGSIDGFGLKYWRVNSWVVVKQLKETKDSHLRNNPLILTVLKRKGISEVPHPSIDTHPTSGVH